MQTYNNYNIALYFTTRCIDSINTVSELEKSFTFFEKHLKCSKVYLETHRDDMDIPKEKLLELKSFFEAKGVKVSGAITTTFMKTFKNKPLIEETGVFGSGGTILGQTGTPEVKEGYKKTCSTICYVDEANRSRLKEIVTYTASLFDEIILDDFYFTTCTCPDCIKAKGGKSWEEFRLNLMTEVSENIVISPAKTANPDVNLIIKFPNWYEAYQENGYNPETQSIMFDEVYTGTETRDTNHSTQHLPRYGSYSIMRWFENLKPGHNGGGWVDQLDSIQNLAYYLEQAFLTLFAKGRELTLFCYSWLVDTVYIPALGFELDRLDQVLGEVGTPKGILAYEPFHAHGEDHLYDYLGMAGLSFEPCHKFLDTTSLIFVSENSTKDPAIIDKIKEHLLKGGDVCITSGFLRCMQDKGVEDITSAKYTDRKVTSSDYWIQGQSSVGRKNVTVPGISYMINSADCIIGIHKEDNNFPILLKNTYGRGTVYTLVIPDDFAEVYRFPTEVLATIRQYLMSDMGIYFEGREKMGIFLYDNDTFILQSFQDYSYSVKIHVVGNSKKLVDVRTGEVLSPICTKGSESIFETSLMPVFYKLFRIIDDVE